MPHQTHRLRACFKTLKNWVISLYLTDQETIQVHPESSFLLKSHGSTVEPVYNVSGLYIQVAVIEKTCIRWSAAFSGYDHYK